MSVQNKVFYIENGKFYISRYVLIAIFRLLIGSQRPDKWSGELLLQRFKRSLPLYPDKTAGIFHPVFERAASVPFENWVLTENPLPRFETLYPQINPDTGSLKDVVDDENEQTLENSTPAIFFDVEKSQSIQHWKQRPKFRFDAFGIEPGSILTFKRDKSITVMTVDGKTGVESDAHDEGASWTDITRQLTGFSQVAPVDYWCHDGVLLRKMYDGKYGDSRKRPGTPRPPEVDAATLAVKTEPEPPSITEQVETQVQESSIDIVEPVTAISLPETPPEPVGAPLPSEPEQESSEPETPEFTKSIIPHTPPSITLGSVTLVPLSLPIRRPS